MPFGTLGKHKKTKFRNAQPCLFIFDIMLFNGKDLCGVKLIDRRRILEENMIEIEDRVRLSEKWNLHKAEELKAAMKTAMAKGLEGLVMKDINGLYEPGKRGWLKMK